MVDAPQIADEFSQAAAGHDHKFELWSGQSFPTYTLVANGNCYRPVIVCYADLGSYRSGKIVVAY
jgi:hypothetical protein